MAASQACQAIASVGECAKCEGEGLAAAGLGRAWPCGGGPGRWVHGRCIRRGKELRLRPGGVVSYGGGRPGKLGWDQNGVLSRDEIALL